MFRFLFWLLKWLFKLLFALGTLITITLTLIVSYDHYIRKIIEEEGENEDPPPA